MNKRLIRKLHRWLGIIAAIQFTAWTVSGFYFTLIPIEEIRGEHLLKPGPEISLGALSLISPTDLVEANAGLADASVDDIQLRQRLDSIV
ncbi:MAG: hypothetical protein HUJ31_06685 [Pseudomonadales bacterium]|nr:hypothetical protein [Pseudomonadales bacterium]